MAGEVWDECFEEIIKELRAENERQAARMKALDEENERLRAESALWESRTKDGAEIIMGNVQVIERLRAIEAAIKVVVDEQANDDGLWFIHETITEDILQRALRRLHEVIEGKTSTERAIEVLTQMAPLKDR
jgi:hypothetical protein